ncbi:MAG: preprotein translocase subunit SecE [Candidatus Eisenbacteria bacterium]|nr:preprotein translocase subunit SecE [Candidatus Eisenbacteria bacterium]
MSAVDRFNKFLGEVKVEATKVTWPSRDELRESTIVVIVAVFLISLFIYAVDIVISKGVQAVL